MASRISKESALAVGLLLLRAGVGCFLAFGHGLPKLLQYSAKASKFADPLHIGATLSYTLATGAELFGALLVAIGLLTRPAAATVLFTMLVAGVLQHAPDPWAKKELALLYALPFATLILTGAGSLSLDALLGRRRRTTGLRRAAAFGRPLVG